jgi:FemAB-related protein (PEP-CTERM system-associated)
VQTLQLTIREHHDIEPLLPRLESYFLAKGDAPLSKHPAWLLVLRDGLGHAPYCLETTDGDRTTGFLLLSFVRSMLFGRFLVSLPYLNYGGVIADDETAERGLIHSAVALADKLNARYLELRQERAIEHPSLVAQASAKVNMRLELPATADDLWKSLSPKVRNQIRKAQKNDLTLIWGRNELLADYYAVFSRNMRDLGTPVYGRRLFQAVLDHFPDRAELAVVRSGGKAVAASLLLHGWGISEVPSASSLREYNHTCANMLLYWGMLERTIQRGQRTFDFGRSSPDSNTYKFKKQWGAEPHPAAWLYYLRKGSMNAMRPDNPRYSLFRRAWQKLPLACSRLLGPWIVRGIP